MQNQLKSDTNLKNDVSLMGAIMKTVPSSCSTLDGRTKVKQCLTIPA